MLGEPPTGANTPHVAAGDAETPRALYQARRDQFDAERSNAVRKASRLANARLVTFLIAAAFAGWAIWERSLWLGIVALLVLAVFATCVWSYVQADRRRRRYTELVTINEEALARIARDWDALPLRHDLTPPANHPYAVDLDLFGHASLFHLLDTTSTSFGVDALSRWLLWPAAPETIVDRQGAVTELAPLIDLRDELALRGRLADDSASGADADAEPFLAWAEGETWLTSRPALRWIAWLSPPLLLLTALAEIFGIVPFPVWFVFLVLNLLLRWRYGAEVGETLEAVSGQGKALFNEYAALFEVLTGADFHGQTLTRLQAELTADGLPADRQLRRLQRIATFVLPGDALVNTILQMLTLWDFHVLAALERWQVTAGPRVRRWLAVLGEVEALAALARLAHDNPGWAMPELDPTARSLTARDLGHPLIPAEVRVANDVEVGPAGCFLLVTGSNMSGKSTLLRAIGVNTVLAQAGGPVCAAALRLPPVDLWTSMRVQDSLEQGVSYFMAELRRLKLVVDAARRDHQRGGPPTLYLLDEILHGTNTVERQIAVRRIVRQLVDLGALGAVSTHDLTLADAAEIAEIARPVYFTETVTDTPNGAAMTFDYKLRPGLATSSNALRLMELIGLDLDS